MEANFQIKNLSSADIESFRKILEDLIAFSQQRLKYDKPVKVLFVSDPENAVNVLGKTAHYAPATKTVTIYVDARHPKDMLRSVAHELVHHAQNCRGDFDSGGEMKVGYAQEDGHLREMEREAYESGNLIFRDFEDGIKTNKKKETIYIKLMEGGILMPKRRVLLEKNIKESLIQEVINTMLNSLKGATDHCQGNCRSESQAGKQCSSVGVDINEMEDMGDELPFAQDSGGGGIMNWLTRSLWSGSGAAGKRDENGKPAIDRERLKNLVSEIYSQALEEAAVNCAFGGPKQVVPESARAEATQAAEPISKDITEPDPHYQKGCVDQGYTEGLKMKQDKKLISENQKWRGLRTENPTWEKFLLSERHDQEEPEEYEPPAKNESFGDDDYIDDLEEEFPWLAKSVKAKEIPPEVAMDLAKEYGDKEEGNPNIPHPGATSDNDKNYAKGMSEGWDAGKEVWMQKWQEAAGNPQPPPQDFWDTATYAYNQGKDPVEAAKDYMSHVEPDMNEYGDHETQAQGGLVASSYSSDPEMDQVEDIARDVTENGGQLMQIATALKDEGFDAQLHSGALVIDNKYFIGKPHNFDMEGEEEIREIDPYVLGYQSMNEADEGGEGVHDIFNLPEPKEVEPTGNPKEDAIRKIVATSSAANVDGVTLDLYSASAIIKVLDAINDQNKEKYLAMDVANMADVAFKMLK